jgi:hypothetical protein
MSNINNREENANQNHNGISSHLTMAFTKRTEMISVGEEWRKGTYWALLVSIQISTAIMENRWRLRKKQNRTSI